MLTEAMTPQQKEIQAYLRRAIPDIARKCQCLADDVVAEMYNLSSAILLDGKATDR